MNRVPAGLAPLSLLGDARLARLASRGDEAAFAAIFRRYHQPLYRYCRAITGSGEDAGDALQNTMLKAMRSLPGERRAIELKPWLFRVAHNESVSLLRQRRPDIVLEDGAGGSVDGPEAGLAAREELRELMSDLRWLPDRQRATVILRELNGLSYAEIASVFDTSSGAAKQAGYDGRVALQDYAKGRAMSCEAVMRAISDRDGKFLRGRKLRGHLRSCDECADFKRALDQRSGQLAAIAPALPATAAAALLQKLFAGGGSAGGGSVGLSAAGGKLVASAGALKGAGAVLAAVTVAASAAIGVPRLAREEPAAHPDSQRSGAPATGDADALQGRAKSAAAKRGEAARRPGSLDRNAAAGDSGPLTEGRPGRAGTPGRLPTGRPGAPGPLPGAAPPPRPEETGRRREATGRRSPDTAPPAARPERPERPSRPPAGAPPAPESPARPEAPEPPSPGGELPPGGPISPGAPAISPRAGN